MRSRTTQRFRALRDSLPKPIQEKAQAAYELWSANPDHPSLRFKKVHVKLPIYSVRIDIDWRAVAFSKETPSCGSGSDPMQSMSSCCGSSERRSDAMHLTGNSRLRRLLPAGCWRHPYPLE